MELNLNLYETMALVSVVFYIGTYTKNKLSVLSKYCIPSAVVGGIIFALMILIFKLTNFATITLDVSLQNVFMTAFFTSIGFTASLKVLKQGGIKVVTFLGLAILLVIMQNTVGVTLASLFNLNPLLGLCTGSIPMVGGHGTAGSFGPMLDSMGVVGATTVSVASATFGLIMGSIVGGLVARNLIVNHKLKTVNDINSENSLNKNADSYVAADTAATTNNDEESTTMLSLTKLTTGACLLFVAMGFGSIISELIQKTGLKFPSYIGAMLAAAIMRNIYDFSKREFVEAEIETLGGLSLSFFLTMALMDLKLWQLMDLALPLIVMLFAQVLLAGLFTYFITYRVMGKNYEAAVFASATCGFGMGATPNAIANMNELSNKYGFAPTPYFVVPIVGCLFIDFFNSTILLTFINFLQ